MPKIKMIVGVPGGKPIMIIDEETNKLLFYTVTYSRRIQPGTYESPEDIIEILKELATKGHEVKNDTYDREQIFHFLLPLLLSDAPLNIKTDHVLSYVRSAIKRG